MAKMKALKSPAARSIVQIQTSVTGQNLNIVALCSDGTVWTYSSGSAAWVQLAEIPQV